MKSKLRPRAALCHFFLRQLPQVLSKNLSRRTMSNVSKLVAYKKFTRSPLGYRFDDYDSTSDIFMFRDFRLDPLLDLLAERCLGFWILEGC